MVRVGLGRVTPINARTGGSLGGGTPSFLLDFVDAGTGVVNIVPAAPLGVSGTFTRATSAWTNLSDGAIGLVASGSPRSFYSPAGIYLGYIAEGARTNLCQRGEDFANVWANVGTPTLSADTTTIGALNLSTLGDDDGAGLEGKTQTITFTGDAVKAIAIYVKQGTSTSSVVRVRDTSANADRLLAAITWSGAVPVVTMTTGTDLTGTPQQQGASGVYRLSFQTTAVTAANTNSLQLYPATDAALATTATGTVQWGGVQAEDATFASSLIRTPGSATVTRNADSLLYPLSPWFDNSVGSAFGEGLRLESGNAAGASMLAAAHNANGRVIYQASGAAPTTINTFDGTTAVQKTGLTSLFTGSRKRASAWSASGLVVTGDGAAVASGSFDGSMGTGGTDLGIGCNPVAGGSEWFGTVRRFAYWRQRMADSQLQQITS